MTWVRAPLPTSAVKVSVTHLKVLGSIDQFVTSEPSFSNKSGNHDTITDIWW